MILVRGGIEKQQAFPPVNVCLDYYPSLSSLFSMIVDRRLKIRLCDESGFNLFIKGYKWGPIMDRGEWLKRAAEGV